MPYAKKLKTSPDLTRRLDDELLAEVFRWMGDGGYLFVAGTSRRFRRIYRRRIGESTSAEQLVQTVAGAKLFCKEVKPGFRFDMIIEPFTILFSYYRSLDFVGDMAALHGNMDVLKWARMQGYSFDHDMRLGPFRLAAANGHVPVLDWLVENGCTENLFSFEGAACNGKLEVFEWAKDKDFYWDERLCICAAAASGGHLKVLQFLRELGCPWFSDTCYMAAEGGHLDVLKWARENGCRWNAGTILRAENAGHYDVAEWARQNGCPEDSEWNSDWESDLESDLD